MDLNTIINKIDHDEVIKVVSDLINLPSVNPPGLEKAVAEYVCSFMSSKNIPWEILQIPESEERYNVIGKLKGKDSDHPLIFSGHMDVVPVSKEEEKRWKTAPFEATIIDGLLYGRGSSDMKGGLGAAMVAMGFLADQRITPSRDIILMATVDEEDVMRGAKALVKSTFVQGNEQYIICEPTGLAIHACGRGRTWAEILVKGQTAHASIQNAGINAIDKALRLMNMIKEHELSYTKHEILGDSFWQINLIQAGIEPAIVPDSCVLTVDARLVPGQTSTGIWDEMAEIIRQLSEKDRDFNVEIEIIEQREPWELSLEEKLVKVAERSCQANNLPVIHSGFMGTTDGAVFQKNGLKGLIVGPGKISNNVHSENEYVAVQDLENAAKFYTTMMLDEDY
ncbi:MAG: M20 family metallopeptidase [Dehalobacterium sp.]